MAMSRQKKLDKMEKIELMQERPKPQFLFKEARTAGKQLFCTKNLVIGYDEPFSTESGDGAGRKGGTDRSQRYR